MHYVIKLNNRVKKICSTKEELDKWVGDIKKDMPKLFEKLKIDKLTATFKQKIKY